MLYPYQQHVKSLIQDGKSVILQAPTGAGKTRAALAPFIESFFDGSADASPRKCLYVVPMRVLANQFYAEYKELACRYERIHKRKMDVRIQTGEQPNDKRFEGDLIFCTVDQFVSSYLTMPYSLPYRLANVNAGAAVGAYIVLDEFHLLDPESTLPSVMYAVQRLRHVAPVLLMTATFSAGMLQGLARKMEVEVVLLPQEQVLAIDTRGDKRPRERFWRTSPDLLSAEAVVSTHRHRSLVICNTVRRARELFREISRLVEGTETQVKLLHSQFLREDRSRTETELRMLFGKDADRSAGSYIVIATQTIEVGVDVSAEVLHMELAPASALIQRAGRCARYPGESGEVIVYPVESFAPYSFDNTGDSLWKKEMQAAFAWLQQHEGERFDFEKEQALVNAVGAVRDARVLFNLSAGAVDRQNAIYKCFSGDMQGASRLLVRDADSRMVLIHPEPDRLLESPYSAIGFSLQVNTLYGMAREWLNRPDVEAPWRVRILNEDEASGKGDEQRIAYRWVVIESEKQVAAARVIAVHPALAGYSSVEGFLPDCGGTAFVSTTEEKQRADQWERPSYKLESYADHIRRVLQAFQELAWPELRFVAPALERAAGWAPGSVMHAAWLTCLLHDVGKLSVGWQDWAHTYQRQIGQPVRTHYAVAHTTYDPRNPAHAAAQAAIRARQPKPHHASEGALACAQLLTAALAKNISLTCAALTAITRHHTPFARECQPFTLRKEAGDHIRDTLGLIPNDIASRVDLSSLWLKDCSREQFANLLVAPGDDFGWMAYTVLARALRRADQQGTALGSQA